MAAPGILIIEAGFGATVVAIATVRSRRKRSIAAVAGARGLAYAEVDPFGCTRSPLEYLHQGSNQGVTSVLWRGDDDDRRVKVFELHWFNDAWSGGRETTAVNNSEPGQTATCATALLNASFPQFHLRPAGLGTAIRDAIRDDKIEVESDDFNEAFDVTSEDRRFAVAFLDPGMQSLLLESMQGFGLELRGAWLLVHCKPLPPKAMPGLFGLVDRIVATIPSTVSELYPGPLGADLSTPMPDPYGSLVPPAPIADPAPPPPERDLDGNPVVPRRQDPWGPGRPFPDKTS